MHLQFSISADIRLILIALVMFCAAGCAQTVDRARSQMAMNRADNFYEQGDYLEASRQYMNAANAGSPRAKYMLGRMYSRGQGVTRDPEEARRWIVKAAEQAYPAADFEVGTMYLSGDGMSANPGYAVLHFLRAARNKHALSMYNLGFVYALGIGVESDPDEALKWFRMAKAYGLPVDDELLSRTGIESYNR